MRELVMLSSFVLLLFYLFLAGLFVFCSSSSNSSWQDCSWIIGGCCELLIGWKKGSEREGRGGEELI